MYTLVAFKYYLVSNSEKIYKYSPIKCNICLKENNGIYYLVKLLVVLRCIIIITVLTVFVFHTHGKKDIHVLAL